ncbi:MAG: SNF2 helicase associated domain-containing protein [Pirellulaceae bacterium]|nr:SNF2 helicase associated domain-containing protein [Pirellulaceae bacterium]
MSLAQHCSSEFSPTVRAAGERLRQVRILSQQPRMIRAEAIDRGLRGHIVEITWDGGTGASLLSRCTCDPDGSRPLCRHVWATLLVMDQRKLGPGRVGTARQPVAESPLDTVRRALGLPNGRGSSPDWKAVLDSAAQRHQADETAGPFREPGRRSRLAWYVLDLKETYQFGDIVIQVFIQEARQDGTYGKIKALTRSARGLAGYEDPADPDLIRLLNVAGDLSDGGNGNTDSRYRYYGYQPVRSTFRIHPMCYEMLLPRLGATGRLLWLLDSSLPIEDGKKLSWDDGPAWRFRLRVDEPEQSDSWSLRGCLYRGKEERSLESAIAVLAKGLVVFPDQIARCDVRETFPWIQLLRQHQELTVPVPDQAELVQRLSQLPADAKPELPARLNWPEERVEPRGWLQIHLPKERFRPRSLRAVAGYLYGTLRIPVGSYRQALVDPQQGRVFPRDREAEQRLNDELYASGVLRMPKDPELGAMALMADDLSAIVARLVEAGWQVEAEGKLFRNGGTASLNVRSDVDWFELEGDISFDGATAALPDLLKAIRQGDRFVKLSDGSHGMLPEEWLARYAMLAELGTARDETLRFRASQAALLDALLAAQPPGTQVRSDQTFQELSARLRNFQGIGPSQPPENFRGELREYQQLGLGWLNFLREFRLGGCLADDMGLGKTVQVLALLQQYREASERDGADRLPSLVVAPRSLVFNWIDEAARFTPELRVLNYTGLEREKLLTSIPACDLVLTTYGTLRRDIVKLREQRFEHAILDESQAIKNGQSQAAKACRLLNSNHRLAMTGTPVENHLRELWSLFEFLNPGLLGNSTTFRRVFDGAQQNPETLDLLARAVAPFILRRTKQEVLRELPAKTEQTLHCQMGHQQRQQYDQLRDYYRQQLSDRIEQQGLERAKIHVLEALLRLRQVACHPGLLDPAQVDQPSAKLELLLEQLGRVLAEGHKALVFSQFTSLLAIVRRRLDERGISYAYLDGRTRDRQQRVKQFQQDPDCRLFLISLKAGGFGLNLTAAEYVFILDPWWNPAVEAQAVDRAHRIGQTQPVFAYRLICENTVEERILELQQSKRELADAIVSSNSNILGQLTAEDLRLLLS